MKTGVTKKENDCLGTINECRAIIEFLANGCEVFKNVRQHGCVDIVVIHPDGTIEKLDVKLGVKEKEMDLLFIVQEQINKKNGMLDYII